MQNQPISAVRAASLLAELVPAVARVELYPQWSDGTGETVRTTRMVAYDGESRVIELMPVQRSLALDTLLRVVPADWDRPQTLSVVDGTLSLTFPVVLSLPVALAGPAPSRGALLEQRHQLEDPAEPPLAVRELPVPDPVRDCARSLAEGHMDPVDWGVCDPQPAPTREVADVPVVGEAP